MKLRQFFSIFSLGFFASALLVVTVVFAAPDTKPRAPENGFEVIINNGAEVTDNRKVALLIDGGPDAKKMAVSHTADFKQSGLQEYARVIDWMLPEQEGVQNVYVRVFTAHGVASDTFKDTIIYRKRDVPEITQHKTIRGDLLESGDLFKKDGSKAVYYYGENKKRYVFPNEKVFYSWFEIQDFYRVKTVSSDTLSAIQIGGNVVYRPGSHLVKVRSEASVYAVGYKGELFWIENEAVAKKLYGSDWARKVHDIPDTLFGNYTVSDEVVTTYREPPEGYIFTEPDSAVVYIVDERRKRPFLNLRAFNDNGYYLDGIKTFENIGIAEGTMITSKESKFTDAAQI